MEQLRAKEEKIESMRVFFVFFLLAFSLYFFYTKEIKEKAKNLILTLILFLQN
jgi:hypothetical protein